MSDPIPGSDRGVAPGTLLRDARIMTLVGSGFFLNSLYLLAVPPLFPMMKEEFDTTYAALGAVMTAYSLGT
jgi:MFS transporter, FSR family, fosmidomycin resistance protein